ncbi:NarK family nitrate/nitrite MFS transporter [Polynucleobacter sp. IMCC 30228]|uniref:NarK family nitrate/nitrite MFS transporter n=1 Tax=Polynucleobacter sp. IMCC 30228 TaxID=2781011 RepID=UPI001F20ABBE|nr:NarK family nitrate/nitrite MFS transporter [Polynucleobacter sp. IMCC 30228]MCE7527526.1 NarK family nitrate/nitrite MFS transporter [Polynucleobacter sp. IMCC 30228]
MSSTVITRWDPENKQFWDGIGKAIAKRNLLISIPALTLAFSVWMVWSVVVVNLPNVGFKFSTNQLFWLASLPALCGATLRIFYSFAVPIFGGRRWTAISTASLLIPATGIGLAVQNTATPYEIFILLALLCGFGGGNFASSMANISFFYPKAQKGTALGLNAGLGNLGVSIVQLVVPLVITTGIFGVFGGEPQTVIKAGNTSLLWLQNAGFIWLPFIAAASIAAWFGMNDLAEAKASFADQAVIFKRKHNWLMCWLYLGTFGSFIGYSAGFPLLIKSQFPGVNALSYAWLGPLVGALARPIGGWLSDKLGGARVTFWNFIAMSGGVFAVLNYLPSHGTGGNFFGFLIAFMTLFATSGIGNGSTFRMIPVIFLTERQREASQKQSGQDQAIRDANKEAAAVLGFSSAVGAYGGFFIPKSYGSSIAATGGPEAALYAFIVFYVTCTVITWRYYSRKNAPMPC